MADAVLTVDQAKSIRKWVDTVQAEIDAGILDRFSLPPMKHIAGKPISTDSNHTPYVTIALKGVKAEGETPVVVGNEEGAWRLFTSQLNKYLAGARAVEWRILPELKDEGDRFWVRARLSITERLDG